MDTRRVLVIPDGPILIEGPIELEDAESNTVVCDRFMVAVCQCKRSKRYPLCDASHRRKIRT